MTADEGGWNAQARGPYAQALLSQQDLELVAGDGRIVQLDIRRYLADADEVDATVLQRCVPPVLDVGCGPGRIVYAFASAGMAVLGVDVADVAVELTTDRGGSALTRSVFQRVPGEGRWPTVLVLDGNIGIGGDVDRLLDRLIELMSGTGQLIVEVSCDSATPTPTDEVLSVRFAVGNSVVGPVFDWSVVDEASLISRARRLGLEPAGQWSAGGRAFVRLVRAVDSP